MTQTKAPRASRWILRFVLWVVLLPAALLSAIVIPIVLLLRPPAEEAPTPEVVARDAPDCCWLGFANRKLLMRTCQRPPALLQVDDGGIKTVVEALACPDKLQGLGDACEDGSSIWYRPEAGQEPKRTMSGGAAIRPLATNRTHVFWVSDGKDIHRLRRADGMVDRLVEGDVTDFVVDDVDLYWAGRHGVKRVDLATGRSTTLWEGKRATALALDASDLYFGVSANRAGFRWESSEDGSVWRASRRGGSAIRIALAHGDPMVLVLDPTNVSWQTSWGRIYTVPREGARTKLVGGSPRATCLAADETDVYWVDESSSGRSVFRARK